MSDNFKYFVYVAGVNGPQAQVWHTKQTDGNGKTKPFIACAQLKESEELLSIDVLKKLYPLKAE